MFRRGIEIETLKGRRRAQMRGYDGGKRRSAVGEYSRGGYRGCSNEGWKGGICFLAPWLISLLLMEVKKEDVDDGAFL